jgi:predicted nucleotidyltransferase
MNALARVLTAAMDALKGADFALVGGIAVSARTEPRFTRDLDLAVAVRDDAEAETLVREMTAAGFQIGSIIEQDAAERLATVRLVGPGQTAHGVVVDLLFASSGIEPELVETAELLEVFQGVTAPVAQIGHLIALKVLARDDVHRPQDAVDLHALVRAAGPADLAVARTSVELIARRGFARGRDLMALLDGLTASRPM